MTDAGRSAPDTGRCIGSAIAVSELHKSVGYHRGAKVRLQPLAAHDVDPAVEQTGDIFLLANVAENGDTRRRVKFNHDIDVAIRAGFTTCARAEQRRVTDAARASRL